MRFESAVSPLDVNSCWTDWATEEEKGRWINIKTTMIQAHLSKCNISDTGTHTAVSHTPPSWQESAQGTKHVSNTPNACEHKKKKKTILLNYCFHCWITMFIICLSLVKIKSTLFGLILKYSNFVSNFILLREAKVKISCTKYFTPHMRIF